jgi:hypothetical protein
MSSPQYDIFKDCSSEAETLPLSKSNTPTAIYIQSRSSSITPSGHTGQACNQQDLKHYLCSAWLKREERINRDPFGFKSGTSSREQSPQPHERAITSETKHDEQGTVAAVLLIPTRLRGCERPVRAKEIGEDGVETTCTRLLEK